MEKLGHMRKAYTAFSSAQPGGTAAVSTMLWYASSHLAGKHKKGLPMETEALQGCGRAGKACRDVWGTSALPASPAIGTPSSRVEATCHHTTSDQTQQHAQLLLGLEYKSGN